MTRRLFALISVVLLGAVLVVVAALRLRATNGTLTGDQAVDQSKAIVDKLDELVPQLLKENDVPGAAVALVRDGEVAWSAGYGLADRERGVPVTADTVFQVASISKPVTAWGVMRLVESGQLELDAPVEQYLTRWHLPPSSYDAGGVTIRRLLSHTAGLSLGGYPGISPDQPLPTLEESLSGKNGGAGDVRITMEPGAQFSYSGGGYTLLQLVIEEVTGESFSEFMQEQVLHPLGMLHSGFEWRTDLRPATAVAYSETGAPVPNYLFTEKAAAGLYTTAPDLARFVAAEMPGPSGKPAGRGVLTADTLALMFTPVLQGQGETAYGLGHQISTQPDGSKVASHGGVNAGWRAFFAALPEQGEGIVILTNSDKGMAVIEAVVSAVGEIIAGSGS
jgi:CubicO group peptidase (beta-lactamase class C family)